MGHGGGGFGGSTHTNTVRPTSKGALNGISKNAGPMTVHHGDAVLKSAVQASSSKVQQQLTASGQLHQWEHRYHHHWRWGEYGYLPTNSSSMVVGVPTGNTLTVTNSTALATGVGTGFGTVVVQNRAQRIADRRGLSVGGIPVVGPVMNQGYVTVRLAGVAAPTAGQPYATQSQQHLAALAVGKHVRIFQTGVDPNGTVVGQVFLAGSGTNLNERQLGATEWHSTP